jgi:hypothetical protein
LSFKLSDPAIRFRQIVFQIWDSACKVVTRHSGQRAGFFRLALELGGRANEARGADVRWLASMAGKSEDSGNGQEMIDKSPVLRWEQVVVLLILDRCLEFAMLPAFDR